MIKYGLISETDARTLERTIDLIFDGFNDLGICTTEIGVYSGTTSKGIFQYITRRGRVAFQTAIDNLKDGQEMSDLPTYAKLIIGNLNEVYNQLEDDSQHLIFQDACHCFSCCVSSFFCYASKVKVGGFMAWHDTGSHIEPMKDFQHGDKQNPYAYISVRDALGAMLLLDREQNLGWELIFDEADENDEAGGICVFKKLY